MHDAINVAHDILPVFTLQGLQRYSTESQSQELWRRRKTREEEDSQQHETEMETDDVLTFWWKLNLK